MTSKKNKEVDKKEKGNVYDKVVKVSTDFINHNMKSIFELDGDKELIRVLAPETGYNAKIDIISRADDMSTQEKIEAINKTDSEHQMDKQNAEKISIQHYTEKAKVLIYAFLSASVLSMVALSPKSASKYLASIKNIAAKVS